MLQITLKVFFEADALCFVISYRDIAKRAGVSTMTVSRAMRGDPKVRAVTAQKVEAAAQALGYVRNPIADSFMKQVRSKRVLSGVSRIAWVYPEKVNSGAHVIDAYYRGACEAARASGFEVDRFVLGEALSSRSLRRILQARGIRGMLISPTVGDLVDFDFDFEGFAAVMFGYSLRSPDMNRVSSHHSVNQFALLAHIRELGYRDVLYVSNWQQERRLNFGWLASTLAFGREHQSEMRIRHVYLDDFEEALATGGSSLRLPEVIVSCHQSLIGRLEQIGCRIPEDVGFVSPTVRPEGYLGRRLAGMNQCSELIGARAVELLSDSLAMNRLGVPEHPVTLLVRGQWCDGETLQSKC